VGFSETPVTDIELIKSGMKELREAQEAMNIRLDNQAVGINGIGESTQWLVDNTSQLFQMFSNPQFMSQLLGMMTGAQPNGNGTEAGPADPTGPGGH
jgi:hypothetical protein